MSKHAVVEGTPAAVVAIAPARRAREKNKKELEAAADLEARLRDLLAEYTNPALREILQTAVDSAHRVATGTRKGERDDVLRAIDVCGCRTMAEICEETRLTRKTVKRHLDEFVMNDLVEIREAKDVESEGGRPELEYWPRHPSWDAPFLSVNRK